MLDRVDIKYFKLAVGQENIGREGDTDVAARCPVCGDSKKNTRKKRLHLYSKGTVTNVSCFNGDCPVHNKTVYSFLRDFYPALLEQYKRETFTGTMQKLAEGGDVFSMLKTEPKKDKTEILTQDLSRYMRDVSEVSEALEYMKKRGYEYNETDYGKFYFGYQDLKIGEAIYKITGSIVIPLYWNNKMYGFYSRSITDKTFYTYMHDANIGHKVWNWFNIDKTKPVYIFEGVFDAISSGLENVVALMGAKLPTARLGELNSPVFVLDNDRTGLFNSLEYAKQGRAVYVQPSTITEKDMNEVKLKNPDVVPADLIRSNVFSGISAEVRIKAKL